MAIPLRGLPRTGGQWNFSGVLYQLLVTLQEGLRATIEAVETDDDVASVQILVEPDGGGDAQTSSVGLRTVDQVKIRRGSAPWTTRGIVEKVLPDLFRALDPLGDRSSYRFVTDNLAGTGPMSDFLALCSRSWAQGPEALDATVKSYRWGAEHIVAKTLFARIVERLARDEPSTVWEFLQQIEIIGVSRAAATDAVNTMLRDLVDDPSHVSVRRQALTAVLLELGSTGNRLGADALLRSVDLDPHRLTQFRRLPENLRRDLERELQHLQYDRQTDVRPEPSLPPAGIVVFSGRSGQGKTWRLCQAALSAAEAGQSVILAPAIGRLAELENEVLKRIWPATLGGNPRFEWAADVLGRKLSVDGVWLTLFIDDLADPDLARALLRADWAAMGVRLVVSAQDPIADLLVRSQAGVTNVSVPDYTLPELRERLRRAGRDPALIPDDVLNALTRPILADLYCRIPGSQEWTGVSEYELMNRYWTWATRQQRDQDLHRGDASVVYDLADTLLDEDASYPWSPSLARRLHIPPEPIGRLLRNGVLTQDEEGAVSLSHGRLLNWIVAETLVRRFRSGNIDLSELAARLDRLQGLRTQGGDAVGRRLNYVLFDVFWMLAQRASAEDVGGLAVLSLRSQEERLEVSHFFDDGLATIGPSILPALNWLARQTRDDVRPARSSTIAQAIAAVGRQAQEAAAELATGLIAVDEGQSRSIGLKVLASTAAPAALDAIWRIHCARQEAFDRANETHEEWGAAYRAQRESFAAMKPSLRARPAWIVETAPGLETPKATDQVLWLLNSLDWEVGASVWSQAKTELLAKVSPEDRGAARMIRRFRDLEELDRVFAGIELGGINAMAWFSTLARLDPQAAVDALARIDPEHLASTSGWWLPGLVHRTERVHEGLREALGSRGVDEDPVLMDLGAVYQHEPDLLDPATLDLLIDNYEFCLEGDAAGDNSGRITRRHIRALLAAIIKPELLARLAARAGSRFEALLIDKATEGAGRVSMMVDRDSNHYHRILAAIGGEGYDAFVLAELDRPNVHGRTDGVTAALWSRSLAVSQKLQQIAMNEDEDTYRRIQLMHSLAAHHDDAGLEAMIRRGSPVFLAAIDIREGGPPMAADVVAGIKFRLSNADAAERLVAINLCGFLNAEVGGPLLAPILLSESAEEEEVGLVISILTQLGYYRPEFLPVVRRRLDREERGISAARYLVSHGDEQARAALVDWLDDHPLSRLSSSEMPVILHLAKFEDSHPGAVRFLQRLRATGLGRGSEGSILSILAEAGDETAARDLHSVANRSPRNGSGAVVAAIRSLSQSLPVEGQAAAERLFRRSHDLGAAALLLRIDPRSGVETVLREYSAMTVLNRWGAGRLLRRLGDRSLALARLEAAAQSASAGDRRMAAELGGWMAFEEDCGFLDSLADDRDPDVEDAALDALRRRTADANAADLIGTIPNQPRCRQWAWLCSLVEMSDPSHLSTRSDPRSIQALLGELGEDFLQEANRLMDARSKLLKSEAEKRQKEFGDAQ